MSIHSADFIDWDDAFNNGKHVPGVAGMPEAWSVAAEKFRQEHQDAGRPMKLDMPYAEVPGVGSHRADADWQQNDRPCLDLFGPEKASQGLVVFVHGGYWHKFSKSYWSHLSAGPLSHGWSVAIAGYTLAPRARLTQMTQEIAAAVEQAAQQVPGPIRLVGHSAGGHLVARLLGQDSPLSQAVQQRIDRVVPISGLYDLRPFLATAMNEILRLSPDEAVAQSPINCLRINHIPINLWVGCEERPEFLRQTRSLCEQWASHDGLVQATYEPGRNHYTVIDGLVDPESALVQALLG